MRTDPDWLSVRTIATRLDVSIYQVRKWIQAGQFEEIAVFGPRLYRVSRPSFDKFVKASKNKAS